MSHSDHLHALAATARIANIPSVVSNVWLGIAVAAAGRDLPVGHLGGLAAALGLTGVSLYLAGNFLNDWADRDWDAVHRPERALPQALFPAGFYLFLALACGGLGLGAAAAVHARCLIVALALGICILFYTWVHKRSALAVIPMGLCRALLPVLGFCGFGATAGWPFAIGENASPAGGPAAVLACACGLFFHVAGLSLSARGESLELPRAGAWRFARVLFVAAAGSMLFASCQGLSVPLLTSLLGLLPYGLWILLCFTVFRQPVSRHVANLLAGIPLVDWIVLLPLALAPPAAGWPPAVSAACWWLPAVALVAGKSLQKLAPAT